MQKLYPVLLLYSIPLALILVLHRPKPKKATPPINEKQLMQELEKLLSSSYDSAIVIDSVTLFLKQ